jgi:DnaJ-class molecular chaperone
MAIKPDSIPELLRFPRENELSLSAADAFLLSRIDGRTAVATLAEISGQPLEQTLAMLQKLLAHAFIKVKAAAAARAPTERSESILARLDREEGEPIGRALPRNVRQKLLLYAENLEQRDHYQILGLPHSAPAEQIKKSYLALSKELHPDRYFGKELGDYKLLLDKVFARLSQAHETLNDGEKRKAYDRTMAIADPAAAHGETAAAPAAAAARGTGPRRPPERNLDKILADEERDPELRRVDRETRRKILAAYLKLDQDYYAILEIQRRANFDAIDRAYQYHLSRFAKEAFAHDLGPYERRREKIIERLQLAKKALLDPSAREKYDRELPPEEEAGVAAKLDAKSKFFENVYRARIYHQRGEEALRSGDRAAAAVNFKLAAALHPEEKQYARAAAQLKDVNQEVHLENLYKKAAQRERDGDHKQALDLFEEIFAAGLKAPRVHAALARLKFALNRDLVEARDHALHALHGTAESAAGRCLLGRILLASGHEREAKKEFKRALEIDKTCSEAETLLAAVKK